jgi:NitT/TauT family transport system substrate-binding protein
VVLTLLLLAACGGTPAPVSDASTVTMRVGYFPNITHSQALIGVARGDFAGVLGPDVTLDTKVFNAGPSVIEAIFANQLDLAYIGPNPAINGYQKSSGEALRIVSGATSGGAALVVRPDAGIQTAADLDGKQIATPQMGNTQDIALRAYLAANGLKPVENGGTVQVIPVDNPQIFDLFRQGRIDGAWVPEPWATRLIVEGDGQLFLDERDLWPDGEFVTAHVIVSTPFLQAHPDLVKAWLQAHVEITQWANDNPDQAKGLVNAEIERLTGKALPAEVIDGAWSRLRLTYDPLAASLFTSAEHAYTAGFFKELPDLQGIYDLRLLNDVLQAKDLPAAAGN